MAKCFIITGCIECPYRTGYYFPRCIKTDARLDNVKLDEWEYEGESDKLDYPNWCPLQDTETQRL